MGDDNAVTVRIVNDILMQSGLAVTSEERDWLVRVYPIQRRMANRLRVPEVRDIGPAVMPSSRSLH